MIDSGTLFHVTYDDDFLTSLAMIWVMLKWETVLHLRLSVMEIFFED